MVTVCRTFIPDSERVPMSELETIRDTHYKGISSNELDLAANVFAEDVVTTTPQGVINGLDAFRQFGEVFAAAVPSALIGCGVMGRCV